MTKFFILFLSLLVSSTAFTYDAGKKYDLTFFHVSDTHGHFYKSPANNEGGFAILSTLVKNARQEARQNNSLFFLTSGGDVNTGTPESDLLLAEPDFRAMQAIGFDAMAIGNHEFDKHWQVLSQQHSWAQFPFLSANIRSAKAQYLPIIPFIIKEEQNLRVAFLGLTTEDTPFLSLPANTQGLIFDPAIATAQKWIPFLRQRADVVVVLSHLGWCPLGNCAAPNDVLLARAVPGIDLILGGHSHSSLPVPEVENGTFIFHTFEKNQKVGILNLEFLDGKISLKSSELKPIAGEEDPALLAILDPLRQLSAEKLKTVVGETPVFLDGERANVRYKETNLGNLVTKTLQLRTQADLTLINSGGIRASIAPGPITYGDIFKVLPFGNTVCTVELTGAELVKYMEVIAKMNPGEGNFPQMSGVTLTTNTENKILELKINHEEIKAEKIYKLAMNNFMAEGGDFYPKVKDLPSFIDTGLTVEYIFRSYIVDQKVIDPKEFEITNYYQRGVPLH
ncbi:MAG: 5'-nucleotidase C-terminal domain-containing protein [Bdellovibrio sp.]|nr:5'-nucleotidase C-terminal domain-containing protein [Bdellovibrio sp.]